MTALDQLISDYRMAVRHEPDEEIKAEAESRITAAQREQQELVRALRDLEWANGPGRCLYCGGDGYNGHEQQCKLAALLSRFPVHVEASQ